MTKPQFNRKHDRDVWDPIPPQDDENKAPAPLSKFQQHFQNRTVIVGKDGANAQLVPVKTEKPAGTGGGAQPRKGPPLLKAASPMRGGIVAPGELSSHAPKVSRRAVKTNQPTASPAPASITTTTSTTTTTIARRDVSPTPQNPNPTTTGSTAPPQRSPMVLSLQRLQAPAAAANISVELSPHHSAPHSGKLQPGPERRPSSGQRLSPIVQQTSSHTSPVVVPSHSDAAAGHVAEDDQEEDAPPIMQLRFCPTGVLPMSLQQQASKNKRKNSAPPLPSSQSAPNSSQRASSETPGNNTPVCKPGVPRFAKKPKKTHPQQPDGEDTSKTETRRRVEYTPHTLEDYKNLVKDYQHRAAKQSRGLGPSDTDEQRLARERKQREREFAERIERERPPRDGSDATAGGASTQASTTTTIVQPPPKERVTALERRAKALAYSNAVVDQHKAHAALRQRAQEDEAALSEERAEEERRRRAAAAHKPRTAEEVAAAERQQRLLDLEAKHAQNKEAVDSIRRHWEIRS